MIVRLRNYFFAVLLGLHGISAFAEPLQASSETHRFEVTAWVNYRCFGGVPATKADPRTHVKCDNTDKQLVFLNKEPISITLKKEATPDNDPTLVGSFLRDFNFQGRSFSTLISLTKSASKSSSDVYTLMLLASSDVRPEVDSRFAIQSNSVQSLNPSTVSFFAIDDTVTIDFKLMVHPLPN